MRQTRETGKSAARQRFVKGLVSEDFTECEPFLDVITKYKGGSREFSAALADASRVWIAEVTNELGRYLTKYRGSDRARTFYRIALESGVDVKLNLANLLSKDPAQWDYAQKLYQEVIAEGDSDGLNNLAQLQSVR